MQNQGKETKKESFYRWLNGETTHNEEKFEVETIEEAEKIVNELKADVSKEITFEVP